MSIEADVNLGDLISGKKIVLYTPNSIGETPNSAIKQFVPSTVMIGLDSWFVGYTPVIVDGFNMVEVTEEIASGLQHFHVVDGEVSKFSAFGAVNEGKEKILVSLTDAQKVSQVNSKKFILVLALNRNLDKKLSSYFNQFSSIEKSTWDSQLAEAKAFLADSTAATPLLSGIAVGRGITVDELAQKVVEKATIYQGLVSELIGSKQALETQIQTAATDAALNELKISVETF
jgi:hypothetical protein